MEIFKNLRSRVSNALDTSKNQYLFSHLSNEKFLKARWNTLKRMGTMKPALPFPFNYFTANELNLHFASTINRHPPITLADLNTVLSLKINLPQNIPLFNFSPTFAQKIQTAIQQLIAKSMGHDAISQEMVKLVSPTVTLILTSICNCSFSTSTFPALWEK